jgi:hypothetical protein
MFYVDGWMPLKEVYDTMYAIYRDYLPAAEAADPGGCIFELIAARETQFDQLTAEANADMWRALDEWDAAKKLAVLTPSGGIVSPIAEIIARHSNDSVGGVHLDLSVGTIGSTDWWPDGYEPTYQDTLEDSYPSEFEDAKRRRYGPFTFCPLLVDRQEAESALKRMKAGRPFERRMPSDDEIVQDVVEWMQRYESGVGEKPIRARVRKVYSFRSEQDFICVWGKITQKVPALSNKGRPAKAAKT